VKDPGNYVFFPIANFIKFAIEKENNSKAVTRVSTV
jgi:hypothetical protein